MFIETFLKTSFQNVRSSKRTEKLHKCILDEVLNANPAWKEYDWDFEKLVRKDAFGGTFKVDIVGYKNGELKVAILDKAINSSASKNIKNFANTSVGEAARLMFAPNIKLDKLLFVTVIPRVAPRFKKTGEVTGFDDVTRSIKRTQIDRVLQAQYGGVVESIYVYYDIPSVREKKTREEFYDIIPENLSELVIS